MIRKFFEYNNVDKWEDLKECFSDLIDDEFDLLNWKFVQPLSNLSGIEIVDDITARLQISIKKTSHDGSTPEEVMKLLIKNNYTILGYIACETYLGDIQYDKFHNMESLNRIYQLLDMKLSYISRRQIFNYNTNWLYQIDMIFRKF